MCRAPFINRQWIVKIKRVYRCQNNKEQPQHPFNQVRVTFEDSFLGSGHDQEYSEWLGLQTIAASSFEYTETADGIGVKLCGLQSFADWKP